jgi:hypothetical protein
MAYVYILENKDAKCIKIGATLNHPDDRLLDISRMWRGVKGRCQICLKWRLLDNGRLPNHVLTMSHCAGSGELSFEYNTELAEEKLADLQEQLPWLKGTDLNFAIKRIKNLQKILKIYKENPVRIGKWELKASYKTNSAYSIEKYVHTVLAAYLDKEAPFGEVFTCSAGEAIAVIEKAITSNRLD